MDITYAVTHGPEHERDAVWAATARTRRNAWIMAVVLLAIAGADTWLYATHSRQGITVLVTIIALGAIAVVVAAWPFVSVRSIMQRYATEVAGKTKYRITDDSIVRESQGDREMRPWVKINRAMERDGLLILYRDGTQVAYRLCRHCMGEDNYDELRTFLINRRQLRPPRSLSASQ